MHALRERNPDTSLGFATIFIIQQTLDCLFIQLFLLRPYAICIHPVNIEGTGVPGLIPHSR